MSTIQEGVTARLDRLGAVQGGGRGGSSRPLTLLVLLLLLPSLSPSTAHASPQQGGPAPGRSATPLAASRAIAHRQVERAGRADLRSLRPADRLPSLRLPAAAPGPATGPILEDLADDRTGERVAEAISGTTAGLRSLGWPGMDDRRDGCTARPCYEPPDPAVAVGPAHVLHVVEHRLSIHDRAGALLEQAALADLFGPITDRAGRGYGETMPNVAWSPVNRRWLVAQAAWDCRHGWLELAVSETADPVGGWVLYQIDFGPELPSFPALASSDDKVVFTADHLPIASGAPSCLRATSRGSSLTIVDWAQLAAARASLTIGYTDPDPDLLAWRPASNVLGASVVHLLGVVIDGSGRWDVGYSRISGRVTGTGDQELRLGQTLDLTTSRGLARFSTPPAPRLPGGDTLSQARDARPTWAIVRGGRLWFVASAACRPAGDPTVRSCVRVVELAHGDGPRVVQDLRIGHSGWDTFGGGIGVSETGVLFIVRARSSASASIRTLASYRRPSDPPGTMRPQTVLLPGSPYRGERWGRVVRLSPDPVQPSVVWQAAARATSDGWATWVSRLFPDRGSPPSGSITIQGGKTTTRAASVLLEVTSPDSAATMLVRCSNRATMTGTILAAGRTVPASRSIVWSLRDASTGGSGANGSRSVHCQFGDGSGRWSPPASDTIIFDDGDPTVGSVRPWFPASGTLGTSTVPVRLSWTASDTRTGVAGRQVHLSTAGGPFGVLASLPAWLVPGNVHRFRVRVVDGAGNWSDWAYGPTSRLIAHQESSSALAYAGTWSSYTNPPAFGGGTRYATRPGSSATLTFTGRAVAIVSATGPTRGRARVYVDGSLADTVDAYSGSSAVRQLVFSRSWSSASTHVLRIVVEGSAGHPRWDLDAILVQS